ncbi:MAG TPA: glycosyltransferase [Gemmatimonadaceae bacterium]
MRVLFVVTAYPRDSGDVITPWMGETIRRLQSSGVNVEVLAPAYRGSHDHSLDGTQVHRFRYAPAPVETLTHDEPALDRIRKNPVYLSLVPAYVAAGSFAAARLARRNKYDVVHAFWPVPHGLFAIAAKRAGKTGMVSTFFSAELHWKGAARKIMTPIVRRIVRESDAVTVISSYTAEMLRSIAGETRAVVIPFGAAMDPPPSVSRRKRRAEDPFELIFVGRLVERKGVPVLLDAVALLRNDARLSVRIIGDGPERSALEGRAQQLGLGERLKFEGMISSERLKAALDACDALVLPAIVTEKGETEGLGVVLIEAMQYGKLVIATDTGGIPDIVEDGATGILVRPGDAVALSAAIRAAMNDPERAARLAAAGRDFATSEFSWDSIVDRLREVYEDVVRSRALQSIVS